MRLKEIIAPIKDDVNAFEKVFKDHLKSDIFLVDKVISYLVAHRGNDCDQLWSSFQVV